MPLHMRLPKLRGFKNPFRTEYQVVNLERLAALYPEGGAVTAEDLADRGAVRPGHPVKVLGDGDITVKVNVTAHKFSGIGQGEDRGRRRHRRPSCLSRPARADARRTARLTPRVPGPPAPGCYRPRELELSPASRPDRSWPTRARRMVRSHGRTRAHRLRPRLQDAGPAQEDPVHPLHHGDLPARVARADARASATSTSSSVESSAGGQRQRSCSAWLNLFSGGALLQLSVFALGIMPYITASIIVQLLTVVIPRFETLKQEGQTGQSQAHAVHPLPDDRPGDSAVARRSSRSRTTRSSCSAASCTNILVGHQLVDPGPIMVLTMTAGTGLIMWLGELITEQRHRQRHVAADLHLDRGPASPARCGPSSSATGWDTFLLVILIGLAHHRRGRLRRAVPAADPGAVRQADGRAADVRRHHDLHPAEGQPGRRHPGHLRELAAGAAGAASCSSSRRNAEPGLSGSDWIDAQPRPRRPARDYMSLYIAADRLLHVLLRLDHVQPGRGRGQHEEVRRLHPGYPGRATHGGVPQLRPEPDHGAGRALPGAGVASSRSSPSSWSARTRTSPSAARRS